MERMIARVAACVLLSALSLAAQVQAFKGQITGGEKHVLSNSANKTVYQLEDQKKKSAAFADKDVVVIGALDKATATIRVVDVVRALSPTVTRARSVSIDCDACPRAMSKVGRTALQELVEWGRFNVVPDRKKADLVLLFSTNRYLGDYLSGKPDTRPAYVRATYMDVIDPNTGQSLWSDNERLGSFRVTEMTRDLIAEFRAQLEAGEGQVRRLLLLDKVEGDVSNLDEVGK
jgi:hypothetical protein